MSSLQKRILLTCVILAISLFYVPYDKIGSNFTAVVGLLLGFCLLYSFTRIIRDFRRRNIAPPLFPWLFDGNDDGPAGRLAPVEPKRWTNRQTVSWMLKGLVALIVGTVIVILVAKYYPEHLPPPRR